MWNSNCTFAKVFTRKSVQNKLYYTLHRKNQDEDQLKLLSMLYGEQKY